MSYFKENHYINIIIIICSFNSSHLITIFAERKNIIRCKVFPEILTMKLRKTVSRYKFPITFWSKMVISATWPIAGVPTAMTHFACGKIRQCCGNSSLCKYRVFSFHIQKQLKRMLYG